MVIRQQISEERQNLAPELYNAYENVRIEKAIQDRKESLITFERLKMAKDDAIQFFHGVIKSHVDQLETQHDQWKKNLANAREKAFQERKLERKRQRKFEAEQKRLEEQRQAAERLAAEQKKITRATATEW